MHLPSLLASCALVLISAGETLTITIKSDGLIRHASMYIPKNLTGDVALVVDSHAWGSLPIGEAALTDFGTLADKEGFVVLHPQGHDLAQPLTPIPRLPLPGGLGYSWNAGGCCPHASDHKLQDVQFIRDLLEEVTVRVQRETEGLLRIDASRVYATGMSNGGFFTNRLACQARDLFAAIAPVSGVLLNESSPEWGGDPFECPLHDPPLPVLHFHGTGDVAVPWLGNPLFGFPSVPKYLATRLALNGLPANTTGVETYRHGLASCKSHGPHASNVTLCKIEGGGHAWPGSKYLCSPLPPFQCNHDIDATTQIWDFFKRYKLA